MHTSSNQTLNGKAIVLLGIFGRLKSSHVSLTSTYIREWFVLIIRAICSLLCGCNKITYITKGYDEQVLRPTLDTSNARCDKR